MKMVSDHQNKNFEHWRLDHDPVTLILQLDLDLDIPKVFVSTHSKVSPNRQTDKESPDENVTIRLHVR